METGEKPPGSPSMSDMQSGENLFAAADKPTVLFNDPSFNP